MEYLSKYVETCEAPIHFYLTVDKAGIPERVYYTYQDMIRNAATASMVYCFDGAGKLMSTFFVIRDLQGNVVITKENEQEKDQELH